MSEKTTTQVETKIVITIKGESACIGIQRTGCDPILFHSFPVKGEEDLEETLGTVIIGALHEAQRRWQTNPRNPKAELPDPPAPAPTPPAARTTTNTAAKSSQNKSQVSMF